MAIPDFSWGGWWTVGAGIAVAAVGALVAAKLALAEKRIARRVTRLYDTGDPSFVRSLSVLFGPSVPPGNRVDFYVDGCRIFPAMLEAIASAKTSITFEAFIEWSGDTGERFAQVLVGRAAAGVRVHALLDRVGSTRIAPGFVERLQSAGIEVVRFHPPRWPRLTRFNNRTHRKLLVVDRRIGFTGGVGIADDWDGDADAAHR